MKFSDALAGSKSGGRIVVSGRVESRAPMPQLSSLLLLILLTAAPGALAQVATEEDFANWPGSSAPDAGVAPPVDAGTAEAQERESSGTGTEQEWAPFPGSDASQTPAPTSELPPPPPPPVVPPRPLPPSSTYEAPPTPPREPPHGPNTVSMMGGRTLGDLNAGVVLSVGFPLVSARVALGLSERFDVGVGFDTFYGIMNEPRVFTRIQVAGGERVHLAAKFEAGWATFIQPPNAEGNGARWLTGRRNYNLVPGLVLSFEGANPSSARFFFELSYLVAFDTQPFQSTPLEGVPDGMEISGNIPVRGGVEVPISARSSFLVHLGFDLHGRSDDSAFMPHVAVGLVTGF